MKPSFRLLAKFTVCAGFAALLGAALAPLQGTSRAQEPPARAAEAAAAPSAAAPAASTRYVVARIPLGIFILDRTRGILTQCSDITRFPTTGPETNPVATCRTVYTFDPKVQPDTLLMQATDSGAFFISQATGAIFQCTTGYVDLSADCKQVGSAD